MTSRNASLARHLMGRYRYWKTEELTELERRYLAHGRRSWWQRLLGWLGFSRSAGKHWRATNQPPEPPPNDLRRDG